MLWLLGLCFYEVNIFSFFINYEVKNVFYSNCKDTELYVSYVPNFMGAHSQGETLDELNQNLKEVIEMLLEDGKASFESEFIGIQQIFF